MQFAMLHWAEKVKVRVEDKQQQIKSETLTQFLCFNPTYLLSAILNKLVKSIFLNF